MLPTMRYFASETETKESSEKPWLLTRRGVDVGWVTADDESRQPPSAASIQANWKEAKGILLPGILLPMIPEYADAIRDALEIMKRVRNDESMVDILEEEAHMQRLAPDFDLLAAYHNENDPQELEKIVFDAVKSGEIHAEDIWLKVSCLSFHDEDDSIRFRFSYGAEMFKAHEEDNLRENLAADLAMRVFPECGVITKNPELNAIMADILGSDPVYVERLIYSNAPNGGAQFHQDVELGHIGVIYAQLHGSTGWIVLPKEELLGAVQTFVNDTSNTDVLTALLPEAAQQQELKQLVEDRKALSARFEAEDQGVLEILLNQSPGFTKMLIDAGWGFILGPGDVMLLPHESTEHCAWHTVFCLDDYPGHSLSFAVRAP